MSYARKCRTNPACPNVLVVECTPAGGGRLSAAALVVSAVSLVIAATSLFLYWSRFVLEFREFKYEMIGGEIAISRPTLFFLEPSGLHVEQYDMTVAYCTPYVPVSFVDHTQPVQYDKQGEVRVETRIGALQRRTINKTLQLIHEPKQYGGLIVVRGFFHTVYDMCGIDNLGGMEILAFAEVEFVHNRHKYSRRWPDSAE